MILTITPHQVVSSAVGSGVGAIVGAIIGGYLSYKIAEYRFDQEKVRNRQAWYRSIHRTMIRIGGKTGQLTLMGTMNIMVGRDGYEPAIRYRMDHYIDNLEKLAVNAPADIETSTLKLIDSVIFRCHQVREGEENTDQPPIELLQQDARKVTDKIEPKIEGELPNTFAENNRNS